MSQEKLCLNKMSRTRALCLNNLDQRFFVWPGLVWSFCCCHFGEIFAKGLIIPLNLSMNWIWSEEIHISRCLMNQKKIRFDQQKHRVYKPVFLICWCKSVVPGVLEPRMKMETSVALIGVHYGLCWYWGDKTRWLFFTSFSFPLCISQPNSIIPDMICRFVLFLQSLCACHWNTYATEMDLCMGSVSGLLLCIFIPLPVCLGICQERFLLSDVYICLFSKIP